MGEQRARRGVRPAAFARTVEVAVLACWTLAGVTACGSDPIGGTGSATLTTPAATTVPGATADDGGDQSQGTEADLAPSGSPTPGTGSNPPSPLPGAAAQGMMSRAGAPRPPSPSTRPTRRPPLTGATGPTKSAGKTSAAGPSPAGGSSSTPRAVASGSGTGGALLTLGPGTPSAAEAEVIRLVNAERAAVGCPALAVNPLLMQVARAHSQEMTARDGFRHNGPDGRTPFQRLTAAGYDYSIATENIAAGQPNAAAVMTAWTSSDEHRTSMMDCRLTQIGVGVVNLPGSQYGTYWTQDLATPM